MGRQVAGDGGVPGLVRRAQAGDRLAFTHLVERHYDGLLRFCARLMGNPSTAEDLAQETLWRAARSLRALSQPN